MLSVNKWSEDGSYHQFLSNVRQEGIEGNITALRMSSAEASNVLEVAADMIFLDASNSEALYKKSLCGLRS